MPSFLPKAQQTPLSSTERSVGLRHQHGATTAAFTTKAQEFHSETIKIKSHTNHDGFTVLQLQALSKTMSAAWGPFHTLFPQQIRTCQLFQRCFHENTLLKHWDSNTIASPSSFMKMRAIIAYRSRAGAFGERESLFSFFSAHPRTGSYGGCVKLSFRRNPRDQGEVPYPSNAHYFSRWTLLFIINTQVFQVVLNFNGNNPGLWLTDVQGPQPASNLSIMETKIQSRDINNMLHSAGSIL